MINSIEIRNYRNLKELKINSLARINLITGKNNTGKSTLLEAILIYATKANLYALYQLLVERGEINQNTDLNNFAEPNIKSLSSLFTDRTISFHIDEAISIGIIENNLFGAITSTEKSISLRFVKYIEEDESPYSIPPSSKTTVIEDSNNPNSSIGLETRAGEQAYVVDLSRPLHRFSNQKNSENKNIQFIGTRNIDKEINGKLFDNIALSEKEIYVVEALKIIEPNTERIAFVGEPSRQRNAVIKLGNSNNVVPIKSMGDGINRILTIILALVNAENGYLLIDEFENGLHHSVQTQLWNIIFQLSERLNVQVFATTHSNDCIYSFEQVLNNRENKTDGKLIRLDNKKGKIVEVEFDAEDLEVVTNRNIEVR